MSKVDLSQMVHLDLEEFIHENESYEQVMAHFFENLPQRLDEAKLSLSLIGLKNCNLELLLSVILSVRPEITLRSVDLSIMSKHIGFSASTALFNRTKRLNLIGQPKYCLAILQHC